MKLRVLSLMGVLTLGVSTVIQAQDYDDIYYDGSKATTVKTETKKVETVKKSTATNVPAKYKVIVSKNYQAERDVDEYNRRLPDSEITADSTLYEGDSSYVFSNTRLIERFYNPDVAVASNDAELVEVYYDDTSGFDVNVTVVSPYDYYYGYYPRARWGFGYGNYWYDPWYGSMFGIYYDPFFRPSWSWGWYGWHDPYFYGWNWGWRYSWYDPWARPWGHGPHMWNGGGFGPNHYSVGGYGRSNFYRRPGDNRSLLSGVAKRSLTNNSSSMAGRRGVSTVDNRTGRTGVSRTGTMSNGRTRPSSTIGNISSGAMGSRQRPSTISSTTQTPRSNSGAMSNGSMRNRSSSSSYGSSSRSSSSSSRSYSPSRSSGGSYSGGGGYSGGGSSRSSGGGRRH